MIEKLPRQGAQVFRWIACGVATLAAMLHVVHLGGNILFSPQGVGLPNVTGAQVVEGGLMVLYCASLLLCWKWLTTSGWASLALVSGFVGIILWRGAPAVWSVWWVFLLAMLVLILPSVLLLAAAWVSRPSRGGS